jgi:hypothetical protein
MGRKTRLTSLTLRHPCGEPRPPQTRFSLAESRVPGEPGDSPALDISRLACWYASPRRLALKRGRGRSYPGATAPRPASHSGAALVRVNAGRGVRPAATSRTPRLWIIDLSKRCQRLRSPAGSTVKGANIGVASPWGKDWEDRGHGLLVPLSGCALCSARLFVVAAACM